MSKIAVAAALGLALITIPATAIAADGDMSVHVFLTKAEALKKKGPLALMSGDLKLLKREFQGSTKSYRDELKADKAAGRSPHSCPPVKATMDSDQFLAHLRSYPAESRSRVTLRTAFFELMKKRYPC